VEEVEVEVIHYLPVDLVVLAVEVVELWELLKVVWVDLLGEVTVAVVILVLGLIHPVETVQLTPVVEVVVVHITMPQIKVVMVEVE
jgi:hypothetical protein